MAEVSNGILTVKSHYLFGFVIDTDLLVKITNVDLTFLFPLELLFFLYQIMPSRSVIYFLNI
jgi:hypothetical protein